MDPSTSHSQYFTQLSAPSSPSPILRSPSPPAPPPPRKRKSPQASLESFESKRVKPIKYKAQPKKRVERREYDMDEDRTLSPEPVYRSQAISRAASTSSLPPAARKTRKLRAKDEFQAGNSHLSSYDAIMPLIRTYKPYFRNPNDPDDWAWKPHPEHPPMAELEFPNSYASEEFLLLEPKDKDHYNPIQDLVNAIHTLIREYMTPEQQRTFGTLPRVDFHLQDDSDDDTLYSRNSSPDVGVPKPLNKLRRALAIKDGPSFREALDEINRRIRMFKYPSLPHDIFQPPHPNALTHAISHWRQIPKNVLLQIIEENYQRSVGPNIPLLRQYAAFSSTVYGELMPNLVYEILARSNLDDKSLFMDLGSGVGNLVVQASLQSGCQSYGIELMEGPAKVAKDMVPQFKARCSMWGLSVGDIEVEKGDMLTSSRVTELLPKADLIVIDNKVFDAALNEAIRPMFLDLKEGAVVVSLKPFVAGVNARMTERNLDDISGIFSVEEREYRSGDVSWGNGGGTYYVHTVDRAGYKETKSRFESSRSAAGRRSRSSR